MDPLLKTDKQKIHKEIKTAINTLIEGCEALDMAQAFAIFQDSPEFLMMATDGAVCGYQTYLKNNIDYLVTCSRFKLTTYREEIRVLSPEMAVFAWSYGAEATLKTGERDLVENAGASFLFKRIEGEWKVVYYHESSAPPVRILTGVREFSTAHLNAQRDLTSKPCKFRECLHH